MQHDQNQTIGPIYHVAEDFINYFVFLLHMVITAYITFLFYLANRPTDQGTICLVSFFIDWNILAFLTLPLLKYVKKIVEKPATLLFMLLIAVALIFLIISTADDAIAMSLSEGLQHYKPIFLLKLIG